MTSNKFKLSIVMACIGFAALAGCACTVADPMLVEASCAHVDAAQSGDLCKPAADGAQQSVALVPCAQIEPAFRDLYPLCRPGAGGGVAHIEKPEPKPEDHDISLSAISSGSRVSIDRNDGHLSLSACAGSTCSSYNSNSRDPE